MWASNQSAKLDNETKSMTHLPLIAIHMLIAYTLILIFFCSKITYTLEFRTKIISLQYIYLVNSNLIRPCIWSDRCIHKSLIIYTTYLRIDVTSSCRPRRFYITYICALAGHI